MIIKKYTAGRFAGIKDVNVDFKEGLNVILRLKRVRENNLD